MKAPGKAALDPRERSLRVHAMLADLSRAGLKTTAQRVAIVEQFADDTSHPTAHELFERLKPRFGSMSFATVYNTLDALVRVGLARSLRVGTAARFDPNVGPHHHAVCELCGELVDLPTDSLAPSSGATRRIARLAPGFRIREVDRVYRGICAKCEPKCEPARVRAEGPSLADDTAFTIRPRPRERTPRVTRPRRS